MDETDAPTENNSHDEKEAVNNNGESQDVKVRIKYL